jgi:hypothetical protein
MDVHLGYWEERALLANDNLEANDLLRACVGELSEGSVKTRVEDFLLEIRPVLKLAEWQRDERPAPSSPTPYLAPETPLA